MGALIIAVGLTGCSSDDGTAAVPSSSGSPGPSGSISPTASEPPAETDGPDSTVAPTDVPTEDPVQSGAPSRESLLQNLEEVDEVNYVNINTRDRAAMRFQTDDGNVKCDLSISGFACLVENHMEWNPRQRANDGLDGMGIPKTIGWYKSISVPYGTTPGHWATQGTWPSPAESDSLKEGQKVTLGATDIHPDITCGVVDNAMTCVAEGHGFTVAANTYDTW